MRELTDAVLAGVHEPAVVSSDAVTVSGMGGIGKTVLLTAFARAPAVRRVFPDGIFWLAVGQHANVVEIQKRLLDSLGDPSRISTSEEGHARLNLLLADARALIVLDDVWDARVAGEFSRFGRQCRTVLTTRNRDVGRALGTKVLIIDVPSEGDAEALLAQSVGSSVEALPPAALEVIKTLGHHPLAITLAGAMVRNGTSWVDLRDGIRRGLADFADPQAPYQHGSIMSSIKMSYEVLREHEQKRLIELASALSEDSYITVSEIAQLWANIAGMSERDTRKVLSVLRDRAFIQLEEAPSEERRVTLHPLIHKFLHETSR